MHTASVYLMRLGALVVSRGGAVGRVRPPRAALGTVPVTTSNATSNRAAGLRNNRVVDGRYEGGQTAAQTTGLV